MRAVGMQEKAVASNFQMKRKRRRRRSSWQGLWCAFLSSVSLPPGIAAEALFQMQFLAAALLATVVLADEHQRRQASHSSTFPAAPTHLVTFATHGIYRQVQSILDREVRSTGLFASHTQWIAPDLARWHEDALLVPTDGRRREENQKYHSVGGEATAAPQPALEVPLQPGDPPSSTTTSLTTPVPELRAGQQQEQHIVLTHTEWWNVTRDALFRPLAAAFGTKAYPYLWPPYFAKAVVVYETLHSSAFPVREGDFLLVTDPTKHLVEETAQGRIVEVEGGEAGVREWHLCSEDDEQNQQQAILAGFDVNPAPKQDHSVCTRGTAEVSFFHDFGRDELTTLQMLAREQQEQVHSAGSAAVELDITERTDSKTLGGGLAMIPGVRLPPSVRWEYASERFRTPCKHWLAQQPGLVYYLSAMLRKTMSIRK